LCGNYLVKDFVLVIFVEFFVLHVVIEGFGAERQNILWCTFYVDSYLGGIVNYFSNYNLSFLGLTEWELYNFFLEFISIYELLVNVLIIIN